MARLSKTVRDFVFRRARDYVFVAAPLIIYLTEPTKVLSRRLRHRESTQQSRDRKGAFSRFP
jgi:hypothetical protein